MINWQSLFMNFFLNKGFYFHMFSTLEYLSFVVKKGRWDITTNFQGLDNTVNVPSPEIKLCRDNPWNSGLKSCHKLSYSSIKMLLQQKRTSSQTWIFCISISDKVWIWISDQLKMIKSLISEHWPLVLCKYLRTSFAGF